MLNFVFKNHLGSNYDLERIIDDWILMGFLVGNDFIPHLPHLHISHDALPLLYKTYISVLPSLGGEMCTRAKTENRKMCNVIWNTTQICISQSHSQLVVWLLLIFEKFLHSWSTLTLPSRIWNVFTFFLINIYLYKFPLWHWIMINMKPIYLVFT